MTADLMPSLTTVLDYVWNRLNDRLDGITDEEYLWEPVPGGWSVREQEDGAWAVDNADDAPDPAPVTTIAWRMWHLGPDCLAGYVSPALGDWPLPVRGREWFAEAEPAMTVLASAYAVFRSRIVELGEVGLQQQLGSAWGRFAESTWTDLVLHAVDELAHHGAEIALLRDLYRVRADLNR